MADSPEDDFALLDRWAAGDIRAADELIHRHFSSLYSFFRNKVASEVDDLVQRTLLGCVEGRERFRRASSFRTYLFQIARFQLAEHLRRRARDGVPDSMRSSIRASGSSPSAVVSRREREQLLLDALRTLPIDRQIALELTYWEGLSGPEIAEVLGISEATVRTRLFRARKQLRRAYARLVGDDQAASEDDGALAERMVGARRHLQRQ